MKNYTLEPEVQARVIENGKVIIYIEKSIANLIKKLYENFQCLVQF